MSAPAGCEGASVVMMGDKEKESTPSRAGEESAAEQGDYLTAYRAWFEQFAAQVYPDDQLPVYVAGYRVTPAELRGEVLAWTTQYLASKRCPAALQAALCRVVLQETSAAAEADPQRFGFDEEAELYMPLRLMQAVIERVNATCLRYLDNAQLDTLPPPPPPPSARDPFRPFSVSSTMKNSRRAMEDRHVEIPDLEALFGIQVGCEERTSLYGVYDGHVGGAAATYCAAHLHQYLCESPHYRTDLSRALADAFVRTDADYVAKSNEKRANGGSTAVVVVLRGRTLLSGWVGDSQALLVKRYTYLPLVYPHRPDREDERERIQSLGGQVMFWGTWRVNGQLAVSRAIGDARYKPYVSGEPELTTVTLEGDEDFVVIASDGLWDVLSEESVMLLVYCELLNNTDVLKAVPQRLILRAKVEGSGDNISVIVVFLRDPYLICRDFVRMGPSVLPETRENGGMSAQEAAREWDAELAAQAQPDPAAFARLLAAADPARLRCGDGEVDVKGARVERGEGDEESESDSEDLGPETAVDGAEEADADADAEIQRLQADRDSEPSGQPRTETPTPPVHTTGAGSALAENVGESGDESEDEWNYIKGEEKELEGSASPTPHRDPSRSPPPRASDIDRGAWDEEDSSDMNSSPLNPDAPVFVPGGAESPLPVVDRLIAESPRKPLPMDDGELPDSRQFASEATERPADMDDMRDILNGHHSITLEEKMTTTVNGDNKLQLESELLQDIARVQRDTTDFCNIQVGFAQTGDVDPVGGDIDEELLERLKSKERDPMSMSFYSENYAESAPPVDMNAVQTLPDSDDDLDTPSELHDKENYPLSVAHTDTPESHKLLFEQIPETPHGKSLWSDDASAAPSALPHFLAAPGADLDMDLIAEFQATAPSAADVAFDDKFDNFAPFEGQNPFTTERTERDSDTLLDDIAQPAETDLFGQERTALHEVIPQTRAEPLSQENFFTLDDNKLEPELSLCERDNVVDDLMSCDIQTNINTDQKTEVESQELFKLDEPLEAQPALTLEPAVSPGPGATSPQPAAHSPVPESPVHERAVPVAFSPELRNLSPNPPARSPSPVVFSPEPVALSPEPVALSPEPVALSPEPVALSPEPTALSPVPAAFSPVPATLSPEPAALSPVPVALSPEPPALSPEPTALSTVPAALSPVPAALSPEPAALSPDPAALSPVPVALSSVPAALSPEPAALSPEPAALSPVAMSPEPVAQSPVPSEEPVSRSPLPAALSEPRISSPQPVQSPVPSEPQHRTNNVESIPDSSPLDTEDHTSASPDPLRIHSPIQTETRMEVKEAQEICVPVTDEIPPEPKHMTTATPPPTPAVDLAAAPLDFTPVTQVQETLIATDVPAAADATAPIQPELSLASPVAAVAGAVAVAAAAAGAAVAVTKAKTPTATKKPTTTTKTPVSPTKSATKTPISKTATPAVKKTPTTSTTATPRTPAAATKPTTPKVTAAKTLTAKPASPATKPSTATTRTVTTKTTTAAKPLAAAPKPLASKPAPAKSAPLPARPAPSKPAPARTSAPRPAATAAPAKPKAAAPAKPAEAKPLTNGDVRPPIRRPVPGAVPPPKPAAAAAPAPKPAPRPGPAARPAPRSTAPALTKAAPPKPAARVPSAAPRTSADKQSKDLANKRLSTTGAGATKSAPPRTAPVTKSVSRPGVKSSPAVKETEKGDAPKMNGSHEPSSERIATADDDTLEKQPPTPPADNALLPDLVA